MDVQVSVPPPPPPPPPPAFFAETPAPASLAQPVTTATTTVNVTSPPTQDRIWLHPWTVTEMRENASQWSLAGDAGVLLYLEQFSDRLTQRADAIQQHISQTVNAVKSTHTRVLNCLNEFTSLANTQFIENRVYDEDETADSTTNASKKDDQNEKGNVNNIEAQEKVLQRYAEAIQYGLAILDTHFERVEAKLDNNANGGSAFVDDEEDAGISLEPILEPKDPYIFRPLPYLIGTADFMDDDYVGLGDLLIVPDEETYGVEQIEKIESYSAGSDSEEEDVLEDDKDFQVQISPVPIIPAGASRTEAANRPPPTKTLLTDSEDEDDPFGLGKKNITIIDSSSSKPAPQDSDSSDDEPKKPPPRSRKLPTSDSEDDGDNDTFGLPTKPPQFTSKQGADDDFDDKSSTSSKESEPPEQPKPKVMSELEKAVLRRRRVVDDPDAPPENDDDNDDESIKKPTSTKTKTSSNEPSSSVISNLTSQPLTTPSKISKPSIFGNDDDDDDDEIDIFNPKPKLPTVLGTPATLNGTKPSQTKEKDFFDDDDSDDGDIFSPKPKTAVSSSIPAKKNDPIPTPQTTVLLKSKPTPVDVSEDDDFFAKPTPIVTTPAALKKPESSESEQEDMFTPSMSKPLQLPIKKTPVLVSEDEDPLPISKPSVPKTTTPVVLPPVKTSVVKNNTDSEDEMFGLPKKPLSAPTIPLPTTPKVVPSVKSNDDEDDEKDLFSKKTTTTAKPKVLPTESPKAKQKVPSDDDEDLFPPKPTQFKLPPPVVLPPLPSPPSVESDVYDDPLNIGKPVESTPQRLPVVQPAKRSSIGIKKAPSSDEEDANSPPERVLNPGAVKDGEHATVTDIRSRLKINPGAFGPPGFKPMARRKADSITEEPLTPSVEDNDQPVEKKEPAPTIVKKPPTSISDSDDDLFDDKKKKETPKAPVVEQKEKTSNENQNGKLGVKALSAGLKLPLMMPGAQPKPIPKETNNNTESTSNEEPVIDKTAISILRDRAKGPIRTRAAPSRNRRVAEAAASTNDDDSFFSTPKPSSNTTSSPAPTSVPKVPSPAPANIPIASPPSVAASANVPITSPPSVAAPVTGLPDKPAAIAAKQTNLKEKKKFSLFDSDDSEIDELLFGSSIKKNKSSVVPKVTTTTTTTTKPSTKASIVPLDDDDDFLSKRPVKKSTKPVVDGDDIFADVKGRDPPVNKAKKDWSIVGKTDETDDIFNDASKNSSNTSKSKGTPAKNKPTKSFDMFDDPLDVSSKR